jgi:hypothetical protein
VAGETALHGVTAHPVYLSVKKKLEVCSSHREMLAFFKEGSCFRSVYQNRQPINFKSANCTGVYIMENNPPPRGGGEISDDVIWGKKYEKAKRKRRKMWKKREERGKKKEERGKKLEKRKQKGKINAK